MSVLYKGNYYKRYEPICKLICGYKVTELCFGDTIIADYCNKKNIEWTGYDINSAFVKNAVNKGFKAHLENIHSIHQFAPADICMIVGSLYHFHDDIETLFEKMLRCAPQVIISEPVINLSHKKGIIGKLAKVSATIHGAKQDFRYTEKTLLLTLDILSKKFNFRFEIAEQMSKDLIIVINK